jgi:hypothetical protein
VSAPAAGALLPVVLWMAAAHSQETGCRAPKDYWPVVLWLPLLSGLQGPATHQRQQPLQLQQLPPKSCAAHACLVTCFWPGERAAVAGCRWLLGSQG